MKNNILKSLLFFTIVFCGIFMTYNEVRAVQKNTCAVTCGDGTSCSTSGYGKVSCNCGGGCDVMGGGDACCKSGVVTDNTSGGVLESPSNLNIIKPKTGTQK